MGIIGILWVFEKESIPSFIHKFDYKNHLKNESKHEHL